MSPDVLFFCKECREKSAEEQARLSCTITHTERRFRKGEFIAHQGDEVTHLSLLSRGSVKTEMVSDTGITIPIEQLEAPYPLAAAFLFADRNFFPVDVVALEECEVSLISKDSVEEQMRKCKGFLRGFMAFNANRMQFLSERIKIFSQKGIKGKLAYYIVQRTKQGSFDLGRSIASLADYFGVERPSLSRALSEMSKEGVIAYKGGVGRILDYEKLKELL